MDSGGELAREHRTVSRVVAILEAVAARGGGIRLAELTAVLRAPKTSVHGLVKGLVATGYLREADGGYLLGPAVGALLDSGRPSTVQVARPILERLRERFDETVILSTQVGASVVYLDSVQSSQLIRYAAPLRERRPIYPTSTGKCFLARMSPARRDRYLRGVLSTPDELARALDELRTVRDSGIGYNRGETVPDVYAAAGLVTVPGAAPVSVAVVGPGGRVAPVLHQVAEGVREAAAHIQSELRRR